MKEGTKNYASQQNSQMSRLFRMIDPNVDVVLLAPFPIPVDLLAYYSKMLELAGVENIENRLHYITPVSSVTQHRQITMCSPKTI